MPIRIMHVVDHLGKGGLENGLVNVIEHLDPTRFEHVVYAIRKLGPNADRLGEEAASQVICQGKQDTDSRFQVGDAGPGHPRGAAGHRAFPKLGGDGSGAGGALGSFLQSRA